MLYYIAYIFILTVLTENLTELGVKSVILSTPRNYLILKNKFFEGLLTCGYCFSFWSSICINLIFLFSSRYINIFNLPTLLNLLIMVLLIHRLSNMLHGAIDRYFDTRKDLRYNKEKL